MSKYLFLLTAFTTITATAFAQADYFSIIMKRVFENEIQLYKNKEKPVLEVMASQQPDGSWKDVNYQGQEMTMWSATAHMERMLNMAGAYANPNSSLKGKKNVYAGIVNGLQFWLKADPKSKNWWHNEIDIPQKLGELLIMMRYASKKLPPDMEKQLIERMQRGNPDAKTGANKTDIAMHYFYRALLTADNSLLNHSLQQLFMPVSLVDGEEGLQYDYSYLQHGPQLYISGYGEEFIKGVLKISTYVTGTPYAMSKEKVALFSNFYRNSYLKTIRNNYIDFSVHGRGVSRPNILLKKAEVPRMKSLVLQDTDNSLYWGKTIQSWNNNTSDNTACHHHFWKGDYTIHRRPAYSFNVRIVSNRTKRTEAGNSENLYGNFLPDGATNIQVEGPEYYNIMPVWEWDKIPGTTSKDYEEDPRMTEFWGVSGNNTFAGGVSDSLYGVTAYQLQYDGVKANKAWFFFDDIIVCLGSGLQSAGSEHLVTTVNQVWLKGAVSVDGTNFNANTNELKDLPAQSLVFHNNIAYYFPEATKIGISNAAQSGSWYRINNAHPKEMITGNVFKMWIDHGAAPQNASYAYMVIPGAATAKGVNQQKAINILGNNTTCQAVYHSGLKIYQAVIYEPETITLGNITVKADNPCLLQYKIGADGAIHLYLADPLQAIDTLNLLIGKADGSKPKLLKVPMPGGPYKGSTKEVILKL